MTRIRFEGSPRCAVSQLARAPLGTGRMLDALAGAVKRRPAQRAYARVERLPDVHPKLHLGMDAAEDEIAVRLVEANPGILAGLLQTAVEGQLRVRDLDVVRARVIVVHDQ